MKTEKQHLSHRAGWLRASVLGANDGIVSTASLLVGVAAAQATPEAILTAGVAGLVAGAMSMAAGEYVSVSSQADAEAADLDLEAKHLAADGNYEHEELATIYVERGLQPDLAREVAEQLMAHDALGAHARDELGINEKFTARPIQAALASAAAFTVGAAIPVFTVMVSPRALLIPNVSGISLILLAALGCMAAYAGGAPLLRSAVRVTFWGALALGLTATIGKLFGAIV
ncbi:MAG: VIT family protein [Gammaproteobacteria bacterium]|nr:VIT family protein [Gammaproteobacteria bacterium]MDP2140437.1 VIT family protein [Gammaproteobacteria bacterium]MDP2349476.1 VIT family protein [Gammaproteobacteria bacterium]